MIINYLYEKKSCVELHVFLNDEIGIQKQSSVHVFQVYPPVADPGISKPGVHAGAVEFLRSENVLMPFHTSSIFLL